MQCDQNNGRRDETVLILTQSRKGAKKISLRRPTARVPLGFA